MSRNLWKVSRENLGKKTEKSEYSFMQETIKDENSRGKKVP